MNKDRIIYSIISGITFLFILCSGIFLGKFVGREEQNLKQNQVTKLEAEKSKILLLGNSMLDSRVDPKLFEVLTDQKTSMFSYGGSSSAIWYLYLKNIYAESEWKPPIVILFFRDHYLTDPEFRTARNYRRTILELSEPEETLLNELSYSSSVFQTPRAVASFNHDRDKFKAALKNRINHYAVKAIPEAKNTTAEAAMNRFFRDENLIPEIVNKRQLTAESLPDNTAYNFEENFDKSYLPHIIELVQSNGSELILVRVKRRRDLKPDQEPDELLKYLEAMNQYLKEHEVQLIDFTHDERITAEHFSHGDHLSEEIGKPFFTKIFAEEFLKLTK